MTDKNTSELSKLNEALESSRDTEEVDVHTDTPEWAKALLEATQKNKWRLEQAKRRREAKQRKTEEFLKREVAPGMRQNARKIRQLRRELGGVK